MLYLFGLGVSLAGTAHILGENSPQPEIRELFREKAAENPLAIYGTLAILTVAWPATLAFNLYNARKK